MQADTNLKNADIHLQIAGDPAFGDFEVESKPYSVEEGDDYELIEETDEYTLKWNSNKAICQVTFRETELERLIEQSNRLRILNEQFLENRSIDEIVDSSQIDEVFRLVSALRFEDAIVEVSAFGSLIVKLKFPNDVLLLINIPEENLRESNPMAVFSLLENRKTIVDNYNSLENIVIGMEAFLDQ